MRFAFTAVFGAAAFPSALELRIAIAIAQEAKTLELDNTKVLQASAIVDRDRIVQEVLANLAKVQNTTALTGAVAVILQ